LEAFRSPLKGVDASSWQWSSADAASAIGSLHPQPIAPGDSPSASSTVSPGCAGDSGGWLKADEKLYSAAESWFLGYTQDSSTGARRDLDVKLEQAYLEDLHCLQEHTVAPVQERQIGTASNQALREARFISASSDVARAEADGAPAEAVEKLNDKMVVAKVLLEVSRAKDPGAVVAFVRGNHLFMNNDAFDYARQLSPADRDELLREGGAHVKVMDIKPSEIITRPSAPPQYLEFVQKYPSLLPKQVDKPRLVEASTRNLAILAHIKRREDTEIVYTTDRAQWGKPQQWDAGETGKGDCEDFATFALKLCMEAGFPREACLITYAVASSNEWHVFLTVRTTAGDFCIDNMMNRVVTPQEQKDLGYVHAWQEDPYGRRDPETNNYKWVWSPYGD
jgi:predicted transglutaminase-like cysteine proteinase